MDKNKVPTAEEFYASGILFFMGAMSKLSSFPNIDVDDGYDAQFIAAVKRMYKTDADMAEHFVQRMRISALLAAVLMMMQREGRLRIRDHPKISDWFRQQIIDAMQSSARYPAVFPDAPSAEADELVSELLTFTNLFIESEEQRKK